MYKYVNVYIVLTLECALTISLDPSCAGPSGAGKTILLNMLTLEAGSGVPTGNITLNGQDLRFSTYRKYCAYVPRDDTLWATLTPRQHLEHAFSLYRPDVASGTARAEGIDTLLEATVSNHI